MFSYYSLVFVGDDLGLLVALEPHHAACVEAPRELLERLGGQELGLGALHVVEHEEERVAVQLAQEVE